MFARLTNYELIDLPSPSNPVPGHNRLDAAVARVTDLNAILTGRMFGISNYNPTLLAPTPGMLVTKSGRTTAVTTGTITGTMINNVSVNYGTLLIQ